MIDLPSIGSRVHVWPHPGLKVQDGGLAISDGGRWLPPEGRTVPWDEYRYRQLLTGELHLTDPLAQRVQPPVAPSPSTGSSV